LTGPGCKRRWRCPNGIFRRKFNRLPGAYNRPAAAQIEKFCFLAPRQDLTQKGASSHTDALF
jgi:hypothetical protein